MPDTEQKDRQAPEFIAKGEYIPVIEACIIGLVAGGSALLLSEGVNWLGRLRVMLSDGRSAVETLPLVGLVGGLIAGALVSFAPEVSGSGIPQVRAALNRMKMTLNLKTAIVKLIGGTIALGSGLFMGREGPTVQVGAAIAAQLTRWFPTTEEHRRQLIAAGAGAGLTAAFNAPIAGCVFVLEELLKEVTHATVTLAIVACFSAAIIEHMFGHPLQHYATVGAPASAVTFQLQDTLFYVLLGVVCGFFGSAFNAGILLFLRIYRKLSWLSRPLKVGLAGLITGLLVSQLPETMHNYAATRSLINSGSLDQNLVPIAFVCYMFLTLLAYGSGAPGGLFAPTLALGSCVGYMVGYSQAFFVGSSSIETFALVGMGAFFSGAARAPLTAIVIVFEMVGNFELVVPLMISCVTATTVGELVFKGPLYDLLMVWNGIHLHSPDATEKSIGKLKASDVASRSYQFVSTSVTMKQVFQVMDETGQMGVPVVEDGRLVGVVTRADLKRVPHAEASAEIPVTKIMTKNPVSVSPSDTLEDILFLFSRYKFNWLPITRNEIFQGVITRPDVVHALFADSGDKTEKVVDTIHELEMQKEVKY